VDEIRNSPRRKAKPVAGVKRPANSIGGYSINLILVINGLLPHLGRKREMFHHAVKCRMANPLNPDAMIKREEKNCRDQKKFDEAAETFKRFAPVLRAFLPPLLGLNVGDFFRRIAHIAGGILYS
jgi:hypothetical protein